METDLSQLQYNLRIFAPRPVSHLHSQFSGWCWHTAILMQMCFPEERNSLNTEYWKQTLLRMSWPSLRKALKWVSSVLRLLSAVTAVLKSTDRVNWHPNYHGLLPRQSVLTSTTPTLVASWHFWKSQFHHISCPHSSNSWIRYSSAPQTAIPTQNLLGQLFILRAFPPFWRSKKSMILVVSLLPSQSWLLSTQTGLAPLCSLPKFSSLSVFCWICVAHCLRHSFNSQPGFCLSRIFQQVK